MTNNQHEESHAVSSHILVGDDLMYRKRSDRNPYRPLWPALLFAAFMIGTGIYIYYDLATWENSTEEMELNVILWWIYDIAGKEGVAILFGLFGAFVGYMGIKNTQSLLRLKAQNKY